MRPHPEHLHTVVRLENLVDKPMLDSNPSRICARQVSNKFLVPGRRYKRIIFQQFEKRTNLRFHSGFLDELRVFYSASGENDPPTHQSIDSVQESMASSIPARIDSFIPNIESR